jgi:hypothetical protein
MNGSTRGFDRHRDANRRSRVAVAVRLKYKLKEAPCAGAGGAAHRRRRGPSRARKLISGMRVVYRLATCGGLDLGRP